jgi:hypothetical protein
VLVCCVVLNTKGELVHFYINAQVLNKRDKINREVNAISPSLRRLGVGNFVDRLMSRTAFTQKVASEVVAGMPLDMTKEAHVRVLPELVLVRENYYVLKVSIPRISIPTYVADVAQLESNDWKLSSIKFVFGLLGHNVVVAAG